MKRTECIAITRIVSDLIKADSIIDVGEMDMYVRFKEKYCISKNEERSAQLMTLADAMLIIGSAGVRQRREFFSDCLDITVSDGFCDPSEVRLMLALD